MRFFVKILGVAILLQLSGCASKPTHPDWVDGDDIKYAKTQYLIGRGQGATLEQAKDRAHADLAEIFKVAIKVDSVDVQKFKSNTGQLTVESSRRITTSTEQIIRGIQISEIWHDPLSKNIHVLAILPRAQAEESLRQQLKQLDEAVQTSVDKNATNNDMLLKIATLSKTTELQVERQDQQRVLQVVDVTGRGIESKYNSAKFKLELDELLKRVRISPKVLEGSARGLEEILTGALAKAGYSVDMGASPQYYLKASLKLSDLGIIEGWYWQRGNLEISVSEANTGRVWGAKRWPIKSSAKDRAGAIKRALDEADLVLKSELAATIIGMASDSGK